MGKQKSSIFTMVKIKVIMKCLYVGGVITVTAKTAIMANEDKRFNY